MGGFFLILSSGLLRVTQASFSSIFLTKNAIFPKTYYVGFFFEPPQISGWGLTVDRGLSNYRLNKCAIFTPRAPRGINLLSFFQTAKPAGTEGIPKGGAGEQIAKHHQWMRGWRMGKTQ